MLQDFKKISENLERHFQALAQLRPQGAPIRIAFLAHRFTFWHCFASFLKECHNRPTFAPLVAFSSYGDKDQHEAQELRTRLIEQGVPIMDLAEYNALRERPEVLCFETPYAHTRADYLNPMPLYLKGVRSVLVPYCAEWLGGDVFAKTYFGINPFFWRTFTASPLSQQLYTQHQNVPEYTVPVTGNPEYDMVHRQDSHPKYEHIRAMAAGRRILLWTPHYETKGFRWHTWDMLAESMVRIFELYREHLFVVLRPHHFLRERLQSWQPGQEPQNSYERVAEIIQCSGNFWMDLTGQPIETVMACDALISDCSSMIAKAMRLGKSVLYTARPDSDGVGDGQEILDHYVHSTAKPQGVQRFVEMVLRGKDPLLPIPEEALSFACGTADGQAGARMADNLEQHFFPQEQK